MTTAPEIRAPLVSPATRESTQQLLHTHVRAATLQYYRALLTALGGLHALRADAIPQLIQTEGLTATFVRIRQCMEVWCALLAGTCVVSVVMCVGLLCVV